MSLTAKTNINSINGKINPKNAAMFISVLIGFFIGTLIVIEPFAIAKSSLFRFIFLPWGKYIPFISIVLLVILIPMAFIGKTFLKVRENRDTLLFILLFSTPFYTALSSALVHPTATVLAVIIVVWFIRGVMVNRINIAYNSSFIILILFFLSASCALILGPNRESGQVIRTFFMIFPIFCLVNFIRSQRQIMKCFDYLFFFAFITCFIGLAQLLIYLMTGRITTFAGHNELFTKSVFGIQFVRMTGIIRGPVDYSNYIGLCVIISSYFLFSYENLSRWKRRFYISFLLIGMIVIFLSHTRQTWLAMGLCFYLMLFIIRPQYTIHYILVSIFVLLIVYISGLFNSLYEMLYSIRPESVGFRDLIARIGIEAMMEHPFTGVGLHGILEHFNPSENAPHIIWLQLGSGIGIIGTFLFFVYLMSLIIRVIQSVRHEEDNIKRYFWKACLLGLIFYIIVSMFTPIFNEKLFWFYFALLEAALFISQKKQQEMLSFSPKFGLY